MCKILVSLLIACLCDCLVLKHIDELHALHLHWWTTDVDIFSSGKCSRISILLLIIYWCWLFFIFKMFLSFSNWCLCDFLVPKPINELHTLHLHWSFTDVDIFSCGKFSRISILLLIIYWCWLFFMCKIFLSFLIDVYVIFLYWNISINGTHSFTDVDKLLLKFFFLKSFIWKVSWKFSLSSGCKVSSKSLLEQWLQSFIKSFFKQWSQSFIKKFP